MYPYIKILGAVYLRLAQFILSSISIEVVLNYEILVVCVCVCICVRMHGKRCSRMKIKFLTSDYLFIPGGLHGQQEGKVFSYFALHTPTLFTF